MALRYVEDRAKAQYTMTTLAADVMRHFYARQHLGKAVVVSDDPTGLLVAAQKQWLRLSRTLQQRRAATGNAVEILKYTYTITQMQQMQFTARLPQEHPEASLYFMGSGEAVRALPDCLTMYVATQVPAAALERLSRNLLASSLVVDYFKQVEVGAFELRPKIELEQRVRADWQEVAAFLANRGVDIRRFGKDATQTEAIDDAVDAVLEADVEFMTMANRFQRTLDLARPLKTVPKAERDRYEAFLMLALRVQTLTPSGFSARFLGTYADDTFYFSDNRRPSETLAEAVVRHRLAGRFNLVRALMRQETAGGSIVRPRMRAAGLEAPVVARLLPVA